MKCSLAFVFLAACASAPPHPLAAQVAVGAANTDPGGVLVLASQCADMQMYCPSQWSSTVDAIVTSGLGFHGYTTIDPANLRKDVATRHESHTDASSSSSSESKNRVSSVGMVGILPVASLETSNGASVSFFESHEKTVILDGARLEDLTLADRRALLDLAGASSLLTTQIIVGANWNMWTSNQRVEVMVKLADAHDGAMRWSARCAAKSGDYPSAAAALEAASRCVVDALTPALN